jgi:3-hydroxyacyl-[acyl-carrier-protein] dehydratase
MNNRIEARLMVAANHPALPGHFPGEPVVPGVVLLDRLLEIAQASFGFPLRVTGLPQVKFLAPLLPGEEAHAVLEWAQTENDHSTQQRAERLRFRVERAGQVIAQGAFSVAVENAH